MLSVKMCYLLIYIHFTWDVIALDPFILLQNIQVM